MSKIINVSEAASLALHSMVLIVQSKTQLNATQIAEKTGSSKNHLSKVLQRLVKHGYLKSNRGPAGGFSLKKNPNKISFLDIYEIFDGIIEIEKCPLDCNVCPFKSCIMSGIVDRFTLEFKEYMKSQVLSFYTSEKYK